MMKSARTKNIIASVAILILLTALIALAFVPLFTKDMPIAARSAEYDPDAVAALNNCGAYVDGHDFSAELSGRIKARVFGIPHAQKVRGVRGMRDGEYTELAESKSMFASAGLKISVSDGKYTVAEGKSKGKSFVYAAPRELDRAEFVSVYGKPNTGLTRYSLENAVTSAKRIDENTFEYSLDPSRATEYLRCAIKTALDAKSYPSYRSVVVTLVTDGERPLSITARESFDIDKFGGTSCTVEYTEVFLFN